MIPAMWVQLAGSTLKATTKILHPLNLSAMKLRSYEPWRGQSQRRVSIREPELAVQKSESGGRELASSFQDLDPRLF